MKTQLLTTLAIFSLLLSTQGVIAAEKGAVADELKDLVAKVNAKLAKGKPTQTDLAPELK